MAQAAVIGLLSLAAPCVSADPDPLRFFRKERRAAERALEARLVEDADPARLRAFHDLVAAEPHVAGTPGDLRLVDALARTHRANGLEVETNEAWVYLARPVRAELEVVAPVHRRLAIEEDVLPEDRWSAHRDLDIGWNAWSGSGQVVAPVVYANYGTKEDFATLRALGVSVKDRIVLARYGRNFRGHKARYAEEAGAAGLVIFTDPGDVGYASGPTYPEGGWANPSSIQRGSLLTLPWPGDPLTPFLPARQEVERLDPATLALPKIPVQPIGYRAAQEILSRMNGPAVPRDWQGGLPFTYRISGSDGLRVRLRVEQERKLTRVVNVVATLPGAQFPQQRVILGSHHDAWGFGAADPGAGTIVVLEAARLFAEAARRGMRPARTLVFAHWAAEEYGLMGSTEWVEGRRDDLSRGAVAYLNLDGASMGLEATANASPSLKELIGDVTALLPQPDAGEGKTVRQAWTARREDPERPGRPAVGDLGGGSDHEAFLCHVGVASAGLSARGAQGNAYHSTYDDLAWYRKVVGDDYASARLVTRMTALVAARLANADVLPLDPAGYGLDTRRHAVALAGQSHGALDLSRLQAAATRFAKKAQAAREGWLDELEAGRLEPADEERINARLLRADRLWLLSAGLPGRPWYRSAYVAPDADSGYESWPLPLLRGPIEADDLLAAANAEEAYLDILARLEDQVAAPLSLDARVKALLAGAPGRVSLYAKNLDTGASYGQGADDRVRTASTIKVPVLVEAFAQVAAGRLRWDEPVVLANERKVAGAGILGELGAGLQITVRDAVQLMTTLSDNTATDLVLDRITTDAVNARMDTLGLAGTRVLRKFGGGGTSEAAEDRDNRRFGVGVSTAREMVGLLELLEAGKVVSPEASRDMLEILKRQPYHQGIGRTLAGVPVADKPGALDRLRSDVGIVYSDRGRIAMAITVDDLPETVWTVDNPGHLLISRLSLLLIDGLGRPLP